MNDPHVIAQQILEEEQNDQQKRAELALRAHEHKALLDKTNEVKVAQIVQSKLLSDKLSSLLKDILEYLQHQKPEVTKHEMLTGFDQIINGIKKITDVLPKEIDKLNKTLGKPKENYWTEARLAKTLKASFPKFPDIKIPEQKAEIRVTDLQKVIALLGKISAKPDFQKADIKFPDMPAFPSKITIANLGDVVDKLDLMLTKEQEKEQLTGFAWDEDDAGNLQTFTEYYPSGTVTATGFAIHRVKVKDARVH